MSSEERSHKYGGMRLHRHSRREFKYFKRWLKSQKVCKSQSFDVAFEIILSEYVLSHYKSCTMLFIRDKILLITMSTKPLSPQFLVAITFKFLTLVRDHRNGIVYYLKAKKVLAWFGWQRAN